MIWTLWFLPLVSFRYSTYLCRGIFEAKNSSLWITLCASAWLGGRAVFSSCHFLKSLLRALSQRSSSARCPSMSLGSCPHWLCPAEVFPKFSLASKGRAIVPCLLLSPGSAWRLSRNESSISPGSPLSWPLACCGSTPALVWRLRWVGPPALPTPPLLLGCLWGWHGLASINY